MGILNLTEDGFPGLVIALYGALNRFGPQRERDLIGMCAGSVEPDPAIRKTLRRWTQIGLFEVVDDVVSVDPRAAEVCDGSLSSLKNCMRNLVLARRNGEPSDEDGAGAASDFVKGASWLLAQDIYSIDTSSAAKVQAIEVQQHPAGERALQNDTRWTGLRQWLVFLGFAWEGPGLVIDPTVAVRESLGTIFANKDHLSASDFCSKVAEVLPVLDGGSYSARYVQGLVAGSINLPRSGQLSTALSIAILRLGAEKVIALDRKADAGTGAALIGYESRTIDSFTHIGMRGGR
jgi:hypothetical protein